VSHSPDPYRGALMAHSWWIYATVSRTGAVRSLERMYKTLGRIVGKDLAEHLEPGEELEPPVLGCWPDIMVPEVPTLPAADAKRGEKEAVARLSECVSTIRIDQVRDFDPALVSALRALFEDLGPSVFAKGEGVDLVTSESLLASLAKSPDLASTLRAVAAGELEEEEDEEAEEPASDSSRPEVLRKILGEISQHPRARRKAGELLAEAPEIVGKFAERLARIGVEADPAVAKALDVKEREVLEARKALATILRRAENR
jgi:hypothetical protein